MDRLIYLSLFIISSDALLYPRESSTRQVKSLNGIWRFRASDENDQDKGFREKWYKQPLDQTGHTIPMPVPSSFNDITLDNKIRDLIGWVWYETTFYPLKAESHVLFFSSCHYYCIVYVNGKNLVNNSGGHLPFEADISDFIIPNASNLLIVAVNNTLTPQTLPQGNVLNIQYGNVSSNEQQVNFDFFNYAGIHRSVHLIGLPKNYIKAINLKSNYIENIGLITFEIFAKQKGECKILIYHGHKIVNETNKCLGNIQINNPKLWQPIGNKNPGFQYNLIIQLYNNEHILIDEYHMKTGIRKITIKNNKFLINDKPIYFTGFGRHEDFHIHGRGQDLALMLKDYNLIEWLGANTFRTSHYPYSDEDMDEADSRGILVINECPASTLTSFTQELLEEHKKILLRLILRDQHRPSVIMWSIANEPKSEKPESKLYFKEIVDFVKKIDYRPVSAAINANINKDNLAQFLDIIMINRYYSWYINTGHLEIIQAKLSEDIKSWNDKYGKPLLISEYGADSINGFHSVPSVMFTEDYQVELIGRHFEVFDELRKNNSLAGEMIWNLTDFMTNQKLLRAFGNRKGLFTRERYPKAAAKVIRCRYHKLNNLVVDKNMYCL